MATQGADKMTEHIPLPDNMSLVNIGCGQLQWWIWESEEYVDGMRDGHFVGPAFTCRPYLSFIQTACNCHADLLEALQLMLQDHGDVTDRYDHGTCSCDACTFARKDNPQSKGE